jgi:UPF0755 protein
MERDRRRREGKGPGFWSAFTWLSSLASTAVFVLLVGVLLIMVEAHRPGPTAGQEVRTVVIPKGNTITSIARQLRMEGVVRSSLAFRIASEIYQHGRTMKAGEYVIAPGQSMVETINALAEGRVVLHPITIPEGLTSEMVVDLLAAAEVLTGETPQVPPEGAVLPETYMVPRGAERAEILRRMMEAQDQTLTSLWANRAKDLPIKTPEEAVILASIVEKETGVAHERPQVAGVFLNRLRRGMRLESDPTIIYGVSKGRPLGRGILRSELERETPYNTYKINGLPPTPIANPGREALAAVLNPPKTEALFFVALDPNDPGAGHQFSRTYAEHSAAVARLRAAERAGAAQR